MIYLGIILGIVIFLIILIKSKPDKEKEYETGDKNNATFTINFPDRTNSLGFFQKTIEKSIKKGDIETANLNFAKIVEALRQQNINENGNLEDDLEFAKKQYAKFREHYNVEYPQQFLSLSECKDSKQTFKIGTNDKKFARLLNKVSSLGHKENPLIRKDYSLSSRLPSGDFSQWLIDQLKEKDYSAIWSFLKRYYDNYDTNKLKKDFDTFLSKDFTKYITIEEEAIFEIQAFFLIRCMAESNYQRLHICLTEDDTYILAKILSVYSFSINKERFVSLIKEVNSLIKKLDKEFYDGSTFSNYSSDKLSADYQINTNTDLMQKLKKLTISERAHFFDFSTTYLNKKEFWYGNSVYETRKIGIDETTSFNNLLQLELFDHIDNPEYIPKIAQKSDIKEKAEKNGLEIKKSWTLSKIYENLSKTDEGKTFLKDYITNQNAYKYKEKYKEDLNKIINYQNEIKPVSDLIILI